jgi:tape measure domain-containing protein
MVDKTVSIKFEDLGLDGMTKALQTLGLTGEQATKRIEQGFNTAAAGSKAFQQQTQVQNALMKQGTAEAQAAAIAVKYLTDAELAIAQQAIKASNALAAQNKVMSDTGFQAQKAATGVQGLSDAQGKSTQAAKDQAASLKKLESGFSSITSLLKGAIAAFSIKELVDTVDTFTQIQNRLKLVSGSTVEATKNYEALKKTSMDTGTVMKDNVSLFVALTNGMKQFHIGADRTVKVTDTIAKAMYATGSSGEGAKAALVQLGQALGSGALRGDEFNSVNENANGLMQLLAKSITNGSIPALRNMAEQGKLTSKVVFDALEKLGPEIDLMASKTQMTIGQALTSLGTAWTDYVGKADSAAGVSKTLAAGIKLVADNLSSIIPVVGSFAAIIAGFSFAAWIGGIGGVTGALAGLVTLLGGPVAVAIAALVAGIVLINDKTTLLQPLFKAVGEVASSTWDTIKKGSASVIDYLVKQFPVLQKLIDYWAKLGQQAAQTNSIASQQPGGGRQINSIGGADPFSGQYGGQDLNMSRFSAQVTTNFSGPSDLGPGGNIQQLRDGGTFTLPGAGPTDSRLVQFMATPGETISVHTPRQAMNDNIPRFRNGGSIDLGLNGISVNYGAAANQSVTGYAPQANPQPSMNDLRSAVSGDSTSADSIAQGIADGLSMVSSSPPVFTRSISAFDWLKKKPDALAYLYPTAPSLLQRGYDVTQYYRGFDADAVKHPYDAMASNIKDLQNEYSILKYAQNRSGRAGNAPLTMDQYRRLSDLENTPGIQRIADNDTGIINNFVVGRLRDGGVGIVPGAGPVDSRLVAVSPGEQIDVKTHKQQRDAEKNATGRGAAVQNIVVNIKTDDPNVFRRSSLQLARETNRQLKRAGG